MSRRETSKGVNANWRKSAQAAGELTSSRRRGDARTTTSSFFSDTITRRDAGPAAMRGVWCAPHPAMASPRRRLAAAAATPHNTTGNRKGRTPRVPSARAGGRGRAGARGKPEAPRGGGAEGEEETTKERERERGVEREEREGSGRQEERKRGGEMK